VVWDLIAPEKSECRQAKKSSSMLAKAVPWRARHVRAALPDFGLPLLLNVVNVLTGIDNLVINHILGLLSSRAIKNILDLLGHL